MENKMKKLIALFAVSAVVSTSASAAIALSGTASVSYDDNGTAPSGTSYDADLSVVGTAGTTTVTIGMDVEGRYATITGADMATTIGPVTIAADMHDELSVATTVVGGGQRYEGLAADDTGVTISVDAPIGDATVGVDDTGVLTVSGTWSGITMSSSTGDLTTVSGSIAGMDVAVTNDGGSTTWSLGTTVSGVALTLASSQKVTATFGLAGNTMVVSSIPKVAAAAAKPGNSDGTHATNGYGTYITNSVAAYSTVAISRSLTSGATLAATYSTKDDSLTLKASVAF
jgi:fibronectin-binding autotransporter adhesin